MNKKTIHLWKGYLGCEVPVEAIDSYSLKCFKNLTLDDYLIIDKLDLLNDLEQGLIKLKLRPIEDLTDEEINKIHTMQVIIAFNKEDFIRELKAHIHQKAISIDVIEYLHSIHIDYQNLIGQGLAIRKVVE